MNQKINKFLSEHFSFAMFKTFPRHSIRFAKECFGNNPIDVIEIGTYEGYNAKNILKELNVKRLYLIDSYKEYGSYINAENHQTQKKLSQVEKSARKRLRKYSDKITWVKEQSSEAIDNFLDNSIDFIYIDGNHVYQYVKKDIENYWKKVKKGGILAGHDITSWSGVAKAVVEFCGENKLTLKITMTDWLVLKK